MGGYNFVRKHIKKWYLLYFICTLPDALLDGIRVIVQNNASDILEYFADLFLNLFLLQAWIPYKNFAINSVTWFLSCMFALYIITPLAIKFIAGLKERRMQMIGLLFIMAVIYLLSDYNGTEPLYHHPVYRVLQYLLGMILYHFIKDVRTRNISWAVYASFVLQCFSFMMTFKPFFSLSVCVSALIFLSAVYLNSGKNLFQNAILAEFGNISMELYLIHPVISGFGAAAFRRVLPLTRFWGIIEMLFVLAVSIMLSFLYHYWLQKTKIMKFLDNKILKMPGN